MAENCSTVISTELSEADLTQKKVSAISCKIKKSGFNNKTFSSLPRTSFEAIFKHGSVVSEQPLTARPPEVDKKYSVFSHKPNLTKKVQPKLDSLSFWSNNFKNVQNKLALSLLLKRKRV